MNNWDLTFQGGTMERDKKCDHDDNNQHKWRSFLLLWRKRRPGRISSGAGKKPYLFGKTMSSEISQLELETTSTIIVDDLDSNGRVGSWRLNGWSRHGDSSCSSWRVEVNWRPVT